MMRTETEIKEKAVQALLQALGDVDAERFFSLIQREPFDYTKWQHDLWPDKDVEAISDSAEEYRRSRPIRDK